MIFKNSLASILEAIYLKEPITSKFGKAGIAVNPMNLDYILGRIIIFNLPGIPENIVREAVEHSKTVISRVKFGNPDLDKRVNFQPYIMRIDSDVMWDGTAFPCPDEIKETQEVLDMFGDIRDFPESEIPECTPEISIPKITHIRESLVHDCDGNLTCLGWALHQVGVNCGESSKYQDMDVIKTWKVW